MCVCFYREHLLVHKYKACILSFTFLRWSNNTAALKSVMKMRQKSFIWQDLRGLRWCLETERKENEVGGSYFIAWEQDI